MLAFAIKKTSLYQNISIMIKERLFVFKMRKEGKAFPLGSTRLFSKASFRHTPFS